MIKSKLLAFSPLFVLSFCLLFISSCIGQTDQNPRSQLEITKEEGQASTQRNVMDELFFIEGQLCAWVRNIFQDSKGNLWLGTNHYGMMRFDGDTLEYFDEKDGLGTGRINGALEDEEGNIWIATYGGLSKYDGQAFTNFTLKRAYDDFSDLQCIVIDKNGLIWVGTSDGVSQFDGEQFINFPIPKATVSDTNSILSYDRVACMLEDRQGNMWFGTDGFGLVKYDGRSFTHFTKKEGLCDNNISGLMEDSKGNLWIATMFGGISRYDGKSFTNFTQKGIVQGEETGGFYEDKTGNIWFAAENHGVYRYDGKTFSNLYKDEGLNTNGIISILEDQEGRFWFGGWGGLFRYNSMPDGEKEKTFVSVTKEGPWN